MWLFDLIGDFCKFIFKMLGFGGKGLKYFFEQLDLVMKDFNRLNRKTPGLRKKKEEEIF